MYYSKTLRDCYSDLGSGEGGLSDKKVTERLKRYGKNVLVSKHKTNYFLKFLEQFKNTLVIILIIAAVVSFIVAYVDGHGEYIDSIVILSILFINAVIGFIQEFKAEKSVEALKSMMSPHAKVLRNGKVQDILAADVVPGDILLLEEGDKIPADARIIESVELNTNEASLTGESTPVFKVITAMKSSNLVPALQKNMVFMGTLITRGRGKAIVTSTGMGTEFGKIADLTQNMEADKSPLKQELETAGKFIAKATLGISLLVFVLGVWLKGFGIHVVLEQFLFAVTIAVAAIPEGLPATLTIAMALGVQRMAKRNAIVRKLQSVETLGSTRIICSDKTGTLTKNQMTVRKIWMNGSYVNVTGAGYEIKGKYSGKYNKKDMELLLKTGLQANDASESNKGWIGDPTEIALLVSAKKYGLKTVGKRMGEKPFDSVRKLMSVIVKDKKKSLAYVKGAPDALIKKCTHYNKNGKKTKLTPKVRKEILSAVNKLSNEALRVLGFAYKQSSNIKTAESGLTFVGLQGMIDPPRDEVKASVEECKNAGIKIFVITGDSGPTASAIARELNIADKNTKIITGEELDKLNDTKLKLILQGNSAIFARITPEHKLRVVSILKAMGEIVSVTGDGVNDAPALKRADIGIAMGITGTDVSKEAAEMVLADDSFSTIVYAIKEGRMIYSNIKKFLRYMFSSNLGELWTIILGMIFFPSIFIITPIQILWINIATDMLPALSLAVDPPATDLMNEKPRDPKTRIITRRNFLDWTFMGLVMGLGTFFAYWMYNNIDPLKAGTVAFTLLVSYQLFNVINCRSDTVSIRKLGFFNNLYIWGAILVSTGLQLLILYIPLFQGWFGTVALNWHDWAFIAGMSLTILVYDEIRKFVINNRKK